MPIETTVTVTIGSEVSASVLQTASNTIATTTHIDHVGTVTAMVQEIIQWFLNLI